MSPIHKKRVVIVTGASRGLGKAIALRFGRAGDRVVVNFRSSKQAAVAVAHEISEAGGEAVPQCADVRYSSEVDVMISNTIKQWGTVDVLVNNAGTTKDGMVLRMSEQAWDDVLDTNLSGAFHCIRAVSRIMTRQGQGHIVNISSIAGLQGRAGQSNYSASKAGLIGLTRACAKELACFNIKVNAVLPGYLPTDMGGAVPDSVRERILNENALNRVSDAREVADFVFLLCLMNNASGQVFNLDSRIP